MSSPPDCDKYIEFPFTRLKRRNRRHGENSARTAKVTIILSNFRTPELRSHDISILDVPADSPADRRVYACGAETQFQCGARAVDEHLVLCHSHTLERNPRLTAQNRTEQIFCVPCGKSQRVRQPDSWSRTPGWRSHCREEFFQRHVAAAEDIALADTPLFRCEPMAFRNIFYSNHVESGVDISRHPAIQEVDNDAAGRGRLPISRSNRRGGIDHHCRETFYGGFQHFLFRHELGSFVMADHLVQASWCSLIRQPVASGDGNCRDAARVDKSLDSGSPRGFDKIACSRHVGFINVIRVFGPQPIVRSNVKNLTDSVESLAQRRSVAQITVNAIDIQAFDGPQPACRPQQDPNPR